MLDISLRHHFPKSNGGFNLSVNFSTDCKRLALFGPSGSGKTLTLNALAGLFHPGEGRICLDDRVLYDSSQKKRLPARDRKIGYVFQDYALFPHMTVRENIAFPFGKGSRRQKGGIDEMVNSLLRKFELVNLAENYPEYISGGQKQRTALARALAFQPSLLLMDEPFSALDSLLRSKVREECSKMLSSMEIPTIIITHDPLDVLSFAEAVVFYDKGKATNPIPLEQLSDEGKEGNTLVESLLEAAKFQDFKKVQSNLKAIIQ